MKSWIRPAGTMRDRCTLNRKGATVPTTLSCSRLNRQLQRLPFPTQLPCHPSRMDIQTISGPITPIRWPIKWLKIRCNIDTRRRRPIHRPCLRYHGAITRRWCLPLPSTISTRQTKLIFNTWGINTPGVFKNYIPYFSIPYNFSGSILFPWLQHCFQRTFFLRCAFSNISKFDIYIYV